MHMIVNCHPVLKKLIGQGTEGEGKENQILPE